MEQILSDEKNNVLAIKASLNKLQGNCKTKLLKAVNTV